MWYRTGMSFFSWDGLRMLLRTLSSWTIRSTRKLPSCTIRTSGQGVSSLKREGPLHFSISRLAQHSRGSMPLVYGETGSNNVQATGYFIRKQTEGIISGQPKLVPWCRSPGAQHMSCRYSQASQSSDCGSSAGYSTDCGLCFPSPQPWRAKIHRWGTVCLNSEKDSSSKCGETSTFFSSLKRNKQ